MTPEKREEDIIRTAGVLFTQFLLRQAMIPSPAGVPVNYPLEMRTCAQIAIQLHDTAQDEITYHTKTGELSKLPWHDR